MKIITEPTVRLLAVPTVALEALEAFLGDNDMKWLPEGRFTDAIPEIAGRVCYMSFGKPRPGGNATYLEHIKESGHGSVLEHTNFTFLISGVSRSLSHELVRHRSGAAYSQLSQRYVDESVAEYVEPDIIASDPDTHNVWLQAVENSHEAYKRLVGKLDSKLSRMPENLCFACNGTAPADCVCKGTGVNPAKRTDIRKTARGAARSVLPNATETKLACTFNARALRHIIEMRASRFADIEIRKLGIAMLKLASEAAPNLFADYELIALPDGTFEAQTKTRKV